MSAPEYDPKADPLDNIARGLFAVSRSIERVARAVDRLGTGNAATDMGAIEFLGSQVKEAGQAVAAALAARPGADGDPT